MTEILIRTFIKDRENTGSTAVRTAYGNLASLVGIFCNILLAAGKFLAGSLFGSISIVADALNNLTDASSNVISLLGFRLASRKPDSDHPYGYGRYEYLAGLVVAAMVLLIGVELGQTSLDKILNPTPVEFSLLSVAVLLVSIFVKLWLAVFNRHIGELIHSSTLEATAADSRNDVISTGAVLAALLISHFTGFELDGWMGLAVAAFILYSGVGLIKDTIDPLLGTAPDPELVEHIREKTMSYPAVLGVHDLMVHDYGPGRQFASLHVELPAEGDVLESHDLIDNIEQDFRDEGLEVVIHFDPIVTQDPRLAAAREELSRLMGELFEGKISFHDLRMVPGPTHTNLIFDCLVPFEFEMSEKEIAEAIRKGIARWNEQYLCVIHVDRDYARVCQ